jgi:hypothetical protein
MARHVASPRLVPQANRLGLAWYSQAESALKGVMNWIGRRSPENRPHARRYGKEGAATDILLSGTPVCAPMALCMSRRTLFLRPLRFFTSRRSGLLSRRLAPGKRQPGW